MAEFESNHDQTTDSFDEMNLKAELVQGISSYGFDSPSEVQKLAVVPITEGKDVVVQASESGDRAAAYAIAALQRVDHNTGEIQALILTPTREDAFQIERLVLNLGESLNINCHVCIGGQKVQDDIEALKDGPQVVIGEPQRIYDIIARQGFSTDSVKMFVLDSADESLNRGYSAQILSTFEALPESRQVVLLAAEVSGSVLEASNRFTSDPVCIIAT